MMNRYAYPEGYSGIGSDIKWCIKNINGKFCILCRNYSEFENWSKNWHWYYLISWYDPSYYWRSKNSMIKIPFAYSHSNGQYYRNFIKTGKRGWGGRWGEQPDPKRYSSRGLGHKEFKSLLKKGCNPNKKCKCVNLIQRGNWFCPDCFEAIKNISRHRGEHIHDIMIIERTELKREMLLLKLSGAL